MERFHGQYPRVCQNGTEKCMSCLCVRLYASMSEGTSVSVYACFTFASQQALRWHRNAPNMCVPDAQVIDPHIIIWSIYTLLLLQWFQRRLSYTRSVASSSMAGFIAGRSFPGPRYAYARVHKGTHMLYTHILICHALCLTRGAVFGMLYLGVRHST